MEAVYEVVAAYCKAHDINYSYCKEFFQRLQNEAFRVKDELLTEVPAAAQRLWTSPLPLSSMIGHEKELCNIINEAIRADAPGGMRHLATPCAWYKHLVCDQATIRCCQFSFQWDLLARRWLAS